MNKNTAPFMRQAVMDLEESRIREVANAGMGRPDVLAFWFGESDEVTPSFVRQAAIDSLQQGETFYAHNLGLPELREEIARYCSDLRTSGAAPVGVDRVAVTAGGVNALMLAVQALVNAGDRVVVVTPVWPNLTAQPASWAPRCIASACGRWTGSGSWTWPNCWRPSRRPHGSWCSTPPTTPRAGRCLALSKKPSWHIAERRALGSWPMKCMSVFTTPTTPPTAAPRAF